MTWERGMILVIVTLLYTVLGCYGASIFDTLKLHPEHVPFFFNNNPKIKLQCNQTETCPFRWALSVKNCWGYEQNCDESERMKTQVCDGDSQGLTTDLTSQLDMFWKQADFGFVKERLQELKTFCTPSSEKDSSLECVKYTRFCRGKNIYFDFRGANITQSKTRFRAGIFKEGQIGGKCTLDKEALNAEGRYPDSLDSWSVELQQFSSLSFYPSDEQQCDLIMDRPTYLMKLDSGINMYNHFCDFINLYISQHLNNVFSTDINIIMWDTSFLLYRDLFQSTWSAFTDNIVKPLRLYDGMTLCMRDVVFTFLPRMDGGIYYNTSLVSGCNGSSLVRAFSQHLMYRLQIPQEGPIKSSIRVTLLSATARFKKILNQNELVSGLKTVGEFQVQLVEYNVTMPFLDQMKISHNSDIFIGMNGEELTHLLFQPDWAVIFEIYNCNDKVTYFNLARFRGIRYMTWENKNKMVQEDTNGLPATTFPELSNYSFNVQEFMRLVFHAAHYVRTHPGFIKAWKAKYGRKRKPRLTEEWK